MRVHLFQMASPGSAGSPPALPPTKLAVSSITRLESRNWTPPLFQLAFRASEASPMPMPSSFTAGKKLGRYEIRSQIGAGGMGQVFLAQDTLLARKVALKLLPEEVASNPVNMQRFVQDSKAAPALTHRTILTIHESAAGRGGHHSPTEFSDGETLRRR